MSRTAPEGYDLHGPANAGLTSDRFSDLEWKLTYVGSATSQVLCFVFAIAMCQLTSIRSEHDQELDSLLVGPIPVGVNKFIFEADPPNLRRIPTSEILGVTVILLTCSYDGREFVRVGYYVNNEYDSEELNAEPPAKPDVDRVRRNVLAEKPRVTRFAIKWYEAPGQTLSTPTSLLTTRLGIPRTQPLPNFHPNSPKRT